MTKLKSRVARGNLTPRLSQVGSKVGAVLTSPFPTPATPNPACGFPALGFLCYLHLKGYGTYRTGSTFRLGSDELRNHYTIPEFHITKPYSICSSRSHGVTAMSYQTSPSGIPSFSGLADQRTPLSSRPCLPVLSEDY